MTIRTRAELIADTDSNLPDNNTGAIRPVHVRDRIKDLADSALLASDLTDATGKTTPVDADTLPVNDSAASNVLKKVTLTNLFANYLAAKVFGTENVALTGGATVTSKSLGTLSTGTLTLDMGDRPLQHYTNNGAHILAPGSVNGSCMVDITNGASAGAITTSGWTKVTGDSFSTTNGHKFRCHCSVGNGGSLLVVQAMQ